MISRLTLIAFVSLSLTGCVAALPMVMQLASGANPTERLCAMAKMPGQTASLCDHMPFASAPDSSGKAPVTTAEAATK
jgi:hypothetical protein